MSTAPYPLETLLLMARTHRKVIDYYRYVLDALQPTDPERTQISERIAHEERALIVIGELAGLPKAPRPDVIDHVVLERAISSDQ